MKRFPTRARVALLCAFALVLLAACSDDSGSGPSGGGSGPGSSSDSGNGGEGGSQPELSSSAQAGNNNPVPTDATPRYALSDADFAPGTGNGAVEETGDCGSETGDISPANGCMRYIGRVYDNRAEGTVDYDWPGIVTMANFKGTSVAAKFRTESSLNGNVWFDAYVDGRKVVRYPVSSPAVSGAATDGQTVIYNHGSLRLWSDTTEYVLARGLSDGEHELVLVKRSETNFAPVHFAGLGLDAGKGLVRIPTARSARRIEVVGDSYSVGYGDEYPTADYVDETKPYVQGKSGGTCSDEQFHAYTNSGAAYAHAMADMLGAEVHLSAYSGLGMERNYSGNTSYNSFPGYYGRVLQSSDAVRLDPLTWHPQLMVVMLGTNDFSVPLGSNEDAYADEEALNAAYRASYHAFLHKQRELHPGIKFVVGGTPLDVNVSGNKQIEQAQLVIEEERAVGNNDVVFFKFTNTSGYGCAWHPGWKLQKDWGRQLAFLVSNDAEGVFGLGWDVRHNIPWNGAEHAWYGDEETLPLQ